MCVTAGYLLPNEGHDLNKSVVVGYINNILSFHVIKIPSDLDFMDIKNTFMAS